MTLPQWIAADWPAPGNVRAGTTTRQGGASQGHYRGFNLAGHVEDDAAVVHRNREQLMQALALPSEPRWLEQVHGRDVSTDALPLSRADAISTSVTGQVLAVLTADCLPVLFCDRAGTCVAAAHAGWRGLAAGVLTETVQSMPVNSSQVLAWLGPAIGPNAFEVGDEVRAAFLARSADYESVFTPSKASRWLMDIYQAARIELVKAGVTLVYGGGFCTFEQAELFYSFRRDKQTGRMASLVWMDAGP